MKITLIRQDHLGDLVLTTPLIRALGMARHSVTFVARRSSLPVLEGNPHLERVIALEDIVPSFPKQSWKIGSAVRDLQPDLVMLPHAKPASLLIGLRSGYFGKVMTMWGGGWSRLLFCRSLRSGLPDYPRHISDIWLDLARAINAPQQGLQPEISLNEEERQFTRKQLSARFGSRKIVVVHTGFSGNTCNLPIGVYADLVEQLLKSTDIGIVLSGISQERIAFQSVLSRFDGNPRVWNAMGELALREFCSVISESSLVVSVGTGPMHLASALGIPTVSPFCRKIGVCSRVWGNLGASSTVLEPPAEICTRRPNGNHCDFKESLNASQLFEASIRFID